MKNQNHDMISDYFALGVIGAECMTGKRPYRGKNKKQLVDEMLKKQVSYELTDGCGYEDYPPEALDFINQCIMLRPSDRLNRIKEVKAHPWFANFDWDALIEMKMDPAFKPDKTKDNFDQNNINKEVDDTDPE